MSKLPQHLQEAQRLLDAGVKLVKLHQNQKRPVGDGWNQAESVVKKIDPSATGYGIPLAVNGLCSIDPDDIEKAEIGLAALGFDLETWMAAGVRTCSTRMGSGGRSAFLYEKGLRWVKFSSPETGTVLELRAESQNLQDCCPGVQYLDKEGNECSQDYDVFTEALFDNPPALPEDLCNWWMRCSNDIEFLREQQQKFFEALNATAHLSISAGKSLSFHSSLRRSFNANTTVESILERHGYTSHNHGRWAPSTATGAPSVRFVQGTDDLWHSDHASDPLFGNFDAWTAYVVLDHGGDLAAAEAAYQDEGLDEFEVIADDGAVVTGFDALAAEARAVTGRDTFKAFAAKVAGVPTAMLNKTDRSMLAGIVAGLRVLDGMTKPNIEKAFKYTPNIVERNRPKYERNDEGFVMTTTGNIVLALEHESEIGMRFAYDAFTDKYLFSEAGSEWAQVKDEHLVDLLRRLERLGIYNVTKQRVADCLCLVCRERTMDSAQDWLSGLEWDGVSRVDGFFVDYFGVADTEYARAVGTYMWTALAARVMVPGHQVDMIPVLVGSQGVRKSTGIAAMAPQGEFFAEFAFGENETEAARKMIGKLVGEISELRGIRSKEKEHIKGWITRREEEVRRMYENAVRKVPRRLCFIGTTNDDRFLDEDPTGQRRWLPVVVTGGKVEKIVRDRDQLWAEAAVLFAESGVAYRRAEDLAREVHADFVEEDIFEIPVKKFLDGVRGMPTYEIGGHIVLTMNEIMRGALGMDDAKVKPHECRRISGILRKLGWKDGRHKGNRCWRHEM